MLWVKNFFYKTESPMWFVSEHPSEKLDCVEKVLYFSYMQENIFSLVVMYYDEKKIHTIIYTIQLLVPDKSKLFH